VAGLRVVGGWKPLDSTRILLTGVVANALVAALNVSLLALSWKSCKRTDRATTLVILNGPVMSGENNVHARGETDNTALSILTPTNVLRRGAVLNEALKVTVPHAGLAADTRMVTCRWASLALRGVSKE
jgi:hypothetical protein